MAGMRMRVGSSSSLVGREQCGRIVMYRHRSRNHHPAADDRIGMDRHQGQRAAPHHGEVVEGSRLHHRLAGRRRHNALPLHWQHVVGASEDIVKATDSPIIILRHERLLLWLLQLLLLLQWLVWLPRGIIHITVHR